MQHLTVSLSILAFGMGIASFMYVQRLYSKYTLFFLKIYVRYLIVLNISVFLNLALHYLLTNVLLFLDSYHIVMIVIVVNIVGFFLFVLLTYFYLILTRSLIGKDIGKIVRNLLIFIIIVGSTAYGFSTALYSSSSKIMPFLMVHKIFISILSIISLIASFLLFIGAKELKAESQVRTIRTFSTVYIIFFTNQLFIQFLPVQIWIMLSAFNLLVLNAIPIPFLAYLLKEQGKKVLFKPETKEKIENFYKIHGLSKREQEIVDLILAGKSNEEIKDDLFISIFTVKKHVSNIFMKLDINSRSQLTNMVLRAALADSFDSMDKDQ
jgi:DNA-binding CsgD family transcriptional regulator